MVKSNIEIIAVKMPRIARKYVENSRQKTTKPIMLKSNKTPRLIK